MPFHQQLTQLRAVRASRALGVWLALSCCLWTTSLWGQATSQPTPARAPKKNTVTFAPSVAETDRRTPASEAAYRPGTTRKGELATPRMAQRAVNEPRQPAPPAEPLEADESREYRVPLAGPRPDAVKLRSLGPGKVSLVARQAPLSQILAVLAESQGLNIVCGDEIKSVLTITLDDVTLEDALNSILPVAGYTWTRNKNILIVTSLNSSATVPAQVQGRCTQVFELDFLSAEDINVVVQGLLSPVGKTFTLSSAQDDNRRTKEAIVVEDLVPNLERIAEYIAQVDQAPRQVMIEAHVLAVDLKDDNRHGVNLDALMNLGNGELRFRTKGFANPAAPQAFFLEINGTDLDGLVEALQTTTDAKTLASPRLMVINGQTARMQVGQQLGFRVTTTTQTSTLESVQFLDVGVVLQITPRISRDGRILLSVRPEVSTGRINPDTGLPEEETTELQSDVLLHDGQGMLIGGLIKESDTNIQNKVPYLGDLPVVGSLFSKRDIQKRRTEIVIALLPRILPFEPAYQQFQDMEVARARTPLFQGDLYQVPRPWEAKMPDTFYNPRLFRLPKVICELPRRPWEFGSPGSPPDAGLVNVPPSPGYLPGAPQEWGVPEPAYEELPPPQVRTSDARNYPTVQASAASPIKDRPTVQRAARATVR